MNNLLAPVIPAENVLSDKFRVHLVQSDGMEPELRARRDYVLLAPVSSYVGEGVYAIFDGFGTPELFRVTSAFGKGLRLFRDNKHYQEYVLTLEKFEECVVGFVIADIKVKDERFLREVAV
ncbi:conserved hypothetical protein [Sinorhizobium fredii HH103]|uniref:Peptidase S24/S26A/S26B/S26C domain-containing protein n=1 Tax=Sinorhizobium fredii (strain HH103) TaxID=1117943 RepID=G9ABC5_SINF1|nr:hypothetical protein [Sinorhizobium fredii]CCE97216.1 conserved hypothetical protein [Sinorhizobium fredii HH103]